MKVLGPTLLVAAALLVPGGAAATAQAMSGATAVPLGRPWVAWGQPEAVDPGDGGWFSLDCPKSTVCFALDSDGKELTWAGGHWGSARQVASQTQEPRG